MCVIADCGMCIYSSNLFSICHQAVPYYNWGGITWELSVNKDSLVPASVTISDFYMGSQSQSTVLLFLAIYLSAVAYCTCTCKFECKTCASRQNYLRLWVLVVWTLVWFLNWHHFVIYYGFGRLHEFLLSCKDCMFLKCQRSVIRNKWCLFRGSDNMQTRKL